MTHGYFTIGNELTILDFNKMQKAVVSKINSNTDNIKDETINMKDIVTKNL